jgi:CheY-like chemotaxis protein
MPSMLPPDNYPGDDITPDLSGVRLHMAIIAHEMRAPIVKIRTRVDLLLLKKAKQSPTFDLRRILQHCDTFLALSRDLIDYEKAQAGIFTIEPKPFDPITLFNALAADHTLVARQNNTDFKASQLADTPHLRIGDPVRIEQLLENLLGNAQKFAAGQSIRFEGDFSDPDCLVFRITDTGVGIATENLAYVFDTFAQVKTGKQDRGFGVGLSLSKTLATQMEGSLDVISQPGQGTTFFLSIPARITQDADNQPAPNPVKFELPDLKGLTLLIVDDHALQRELLELQIQPSGASVLSCTSLAEARIILANHSVHGIILDMHLEDGNGIDFAREISHSPFHPAIILHSASQPAESEAELASFGIAEYVQKPADVFHMLSAMEAAIRSRV